MANLESILAELRQERDRIDIAITALTSLDGSTRGAQSTGKRMVSAASRARMAAAQRARWSKSKGPQLVTRKRRVMSASARRKIAAAQKARWAKFRAGKK